MSGFHLRLRPMMRIETLVLVVVAWIMATANIAWWTAVGQGRHWMQPYNLLFFVSCFTALTALHFALIVPFAFRWIVRPLLTLLVVASAAAAWYMRTYSVLLDPTMIQNVLRTDTHEVRDLLNWSMVLWVVICSAPPVVLIWRARLQEVPPLRAVMIRAGSVLAAVIIAVLAVVTISRDLTSFMRNQRGARYLITPGNILVGLAVNSMHRVKDVNLVRTSVGADARLALPASETQPRVLVVVVGETARAANFSLMGYARETNPELAKAGVTAFTNVTSCGTSTEVSVPCMFSPYGRENYDEDRIRTSEGLLDVLVHAGYAVKWLDNQSGCKGVCQGAGVQYEKIDVKGSPELCADGECRDEILQRRLADELAQVKGNTVFVLHMMGNHGPAYFKRYPAEFRRFTPDCQTAELRECSREEVVNAYDNAILYTDHVLAGMIQTLANDPRKLESAMIYVSDHGESLGEHGLYLHGIPYSIAPELQTHVPMVVWVSPAMGAGDVNVSCLQAKAHQAFSHDNLFHSVLGLADVKTSVYRPASDIFNGCRGDVAGSVAQR